MTITIRAHFDGAVIVPDEPVDLPPGESLVVEVRPIRSGDRELAQKQREAMEELFSRPIYGLTIPAEALSRESIYAEDPWP